MYLRKGALLNNRYVIETVLGHGGFGITYAAYDKTVGGRVAIKEYLPRNLATRGEDRTTVVVFTGEARQHFAYGLQKFMEEAQLLTRFAHHPNIVSARDFFEAHGTAYMVMEYVEGVTLKEYLVKKGGRISFEEARDIMMPVMDALREVHQVGLLHRDISPDNIYITVAARVKVIDFGAARYYAGEQSKSLSVILKSGYAPEEQYRSSGKQGAWTDIYAVGATTYKALTGQTPPDALDRMAGDTLLPPSRLGAAIPPAAERALLKALAVHADQRFQSMKVFQQALENGRPPTTLGQAAGRAEPPPTITAVTQPAPSPVAAHPHHQTQRPVLVRRGRSPAEIAAAIGSGVLVIIIVIVLIIHLIQPSIAYLSSLVPGPIPTKEKEHPIKTPPSINVNALLAEGRQYLTKKQYRKARDIFEKAKKIDPNNALVLYDLGITYSNLGDHYKAIDAFSKTIELKPDSFGSYYNIGISYGKLGKHFEAIKALKGAIKLRPNDLTAIYMLGLAYISNGNKSLAMEQYTELKNYDPQKANDLLKLINNSKL